VEKRPSRLAALVRTARPRQWAKNVLVFAAPGAAGVLATRHAILASAGAFAVFCALASGIYLLNDAFDVDADRLHPVKSQRPVAAGTISVGMARAAGVVLLAVGMVGAGAGGGPLVLVAGAYVVIQLAYVVWLKHVAVLELAAVASGFVLRSIAGGVAVGVPISQWFLIVASFGSLFMVAGKRNAEVAILGADGAGHRPALAHYPATFLGQVKTMALSVATAAYCLWAFEKADHAAAPVWFQLSIVPFVLALLRYSLVLEGGGGGEPEEVVLGDRPLQVLGLVWLVAFAAGVHLA